MSMKSKSLPTLKDYYEELVRLPLKSKYIKEELIRPELLVEEQGQIALYYCTHNEYINTQAKIFIVGITPGFAQMEVSLRTAREAIREGLSLEEIAYRCKREARFAGSLRKNIITMLDELELSKELGLMSTGKLFEERDDLLHTTSMIPFATFVKGKNYTGHSPQLTNNELLMRYVENHFYPQVDRLSHALIIPLGRCVEEVIKGLIIEGRIQEHQCLLGFPHPSGANVNRKKQFELEKEQMMYKIKKFIHQN